MQIHEFYNGIFMIKTIYGYLWPVFLMIQLQQSPVYAIDHEFKIE